ncbi:hypothetical protein [Hyphomicrobium sp. CS1GBMeth3]|uniref:hypothetical protein n=1 Tax=Hyphomicrobium sp. CS1GBMeth3 TaxID=1892845 RepID=UPI0009FA62CD|nr:hypothetical protein [Hyphomicrobium sp. CS1GBMeth3]
MPFHEKPFGFSTEVLGLLDVAMTRLWLKQVEIGASASDADPEVRASLKAKMRRLDELGMQRRPRKSPQPEMRMATHRYKTGQDVIYHPPRRLIAASRFKVVRLLPVEDGELKYRIKAADENFERVAKESELTRSS